MMTHTDRHFRYLLRLISRHVMLYTEMITTGALLYGNPDRRLPFHNMEHPLGIQLGGSDPKELGLCAKMAEDYGYDEINLNIGCPSNRVKSGRFGACLMSEPDLVAECLEVMQKQVAIPVTVKTRIGIDNMDSDEHLQHFVKTVTGSGCRTFIIHARKAWLNGLSPRQNREIPPLKYETIYRLKSDFPTLEIVINGGITNLEQSNEHLKRVDGVMIGRAACHNPYLLSEVDRLVYDDDHPVPSQQEILHSFMQYVEHELRKGNLLKHMSRHLHGLFQGKAGARAYRRYLSENACRKNSGVEVIRQAMDLVQAA